MGFEYWIPAQLVTENSQGLVTLTPTGIEIELHVRKYKAFGHTLSAQHVVNLKPESPRNIWKGSMALVYYTEGRSPFNSFLSPFIDGLAHYPADLSKADESLRNTIMLWVNGLRPQNIRVQGLKALHTDFRNKVKADQERIKRIAESVRKGETLAGRTPIETMLNYLQMS